MSINRIDHMSKNSSPPQGGPTQHNHPTSLWAHILAILISVLVGMLVYALIEFVPSKVATGIGGFWDMVVSPECLGVGISLLLTCTIIELVKYYRERRVQAKARKQD